MTSERTDGLRAWVEVDLDALRRNARRLAAAIGSAGLIPMVKADGYGLGATAVARAIAPLRPYAFGVATVDEGVALRAAGVRDRVIVFAAFGAADARGMAEHDLDGAALGPAGLGSLKTAGVPVHLEIDTGMGRAGLDSADAGAWGTEVADALRSGAIASVFTHFHSARTNPAATRSQLETFLRVLDRLNARGGGTFPRHAANSDAIRSSRQYHLDLVRPGLYLYGGGRGGDVSEVIEAPEAVASIRARVLEVRDLPPGSTVSYGATYVTERAMRLATLSIGYADGLPWACSGRGHVLIGGGRAPIRGRVCMDMVCVDVTGLSSVKPGDVATVVGVAGDGAIELGDLASNGGTIEYEVLTGLGSRLPRVYTGGGAAPVDDDWRG